MFQIECLRPSVLCAHSCCKAHLLHYVRMCDSIATVSALLQALCKYSLDPALGVTTPWQSHRILQQTWSPGVDKVVQEPTFVPRPNAASEDDGWVLALVFDSVTMTSQLVILDARDITAGPVCVLRLPHHVPALHGCWVGEYLGPEPGAPNDPPNDIRLSRSI